MKRDRLIRSGFFLVAGIVFLLAVPCSSALAAEIGDDLFLNGFVSQGYLNTSENDYLVNRSVNGTASFTEAAITLSARPVDRLRVGIQFLGRNFGTVGGDQVVVDWAYGDYRLKDQLGIRAGKVKLPFGLYNEVRDVDMLRTSIFLPQSIYNERMRDFILAYEGIGVYGNFDLNQGGELDYHVYGGTLNIPTATRGFWEEQFAVLGQDLEPAAGLMFDRENGYADGTADATFNSMGGTQVTFPWIFGGALFWSTPLEGLRFGTTGLSGRYNIQGAIRYDVIIPDGNPQPGYHPYSLEIDQTSKIDHIATVSAEFIRNDWNLAAEYYHDSVDNNDTTGWYALAGYRVSRLLSVASYYSDSDPLGGEDEKMFVELTGLPDYYGWQRDLTISCRFDLTDFWLFKLEYHFIDGVALTQERPLSKDLADPKERHWGMFTAKTTIHF